MAGEPDPEGRPPLFVRWRHAYLLVLGVLAAQVVIYALLTGWYR